MDTAVVSLICIALLIVGGMTMSQGFLTSIDTSTAGLEKMNKRTEETLRTELSPLTATMLSSSTLQVALKNRGQTRLQNFSSWDVIIQYYDDSGVYHVAWLPYTSGALGNNQWHVLGIYLNAGALTLEAFEPGILNPGEEIIIEAMVSPTVRWNSNGMAVVSTANGIPASTGFRRG